MNSTEGKEQVAFYSEDKDYSKEMVELLRQKRTSKESDGSTLSKLDRKHMLSILVYLKNHRPAIKSDIHANISRNSGMAEKLETLEKMGLIAMYDSFESRTCYIILTDKGERVAELIEEMLDIIDTEDSFKPSIYSYWKEKNRDD